MIVKHLPGIEQILVIYPYVVEGGFTVVSKSPDTGLYDAHFGLILTTKPVCHQGYEGTDTRPPQDGSNRPLNTKAGCTEPASKSNARGPQNLSRSGANRPPVVASYDPGSGRLRWGGDAASDSAARHARTEELWRGHLEMAISAALDREPEVTTAAPDPRRAGRPAATAGSGWSLLGVLVVALLASAGSLVWLLAERRGAADGVQSERDAVLRQTEQFVLRLNTYGPDQLDAQGHLPKYQEQVAAVITPEVRR